MLRAACAAVLLLALAACDSGAGEAQQLFEDRALLDVPSGVNDGDDWQVGPAFGTRVQVVQSVTPNPVGATETALLTLDVKDVPTGLTLYRQDTDGRLLPLGSPGTFFESAASADFYTFSFFGSEVTPGVTGLYRLFVLDGVSRVVTYGDVRVEP
jgi:hypothetical protein